MLFFARPRPRSEEHCPLPIPVLNSPERRLSRSVVHFGIQVAEDDKETISKSLPSARVILNTDSLALPRKESELAWKELEFRAERMIAEELKENGLTALSRWNSAPQAYQNILAVLAAEAARRHKWIGVADEIMATVCTNPAFKYLWTEWRRRVERQSD